MEQDGREKALQTAASVLEYRQRSARALYERLLEKGCAEEDAAWAVARLKELGYLNDREYARMLVRDLSARGYGAGRIRMALREKKLEPEDAEAAMETYVTDEDRLTTLASSRLKGKTDRQSLQRAANALFRKGYSWEEIRAALRRAGASADEE